MNQEFFSKPAPEHQPNKKSFASGGVDSSAYQSARDFPQPIIQGANYLVEAVPYKKVGDSARSQDTKRRSKSENDPLSEIRANSQEDTSVGAGDTKRQGHALKTKSSISKKSFQQSSQKSLSTQQPSVTSTKLLRESSSFLRKSFNKNNIAQGLQPRPSLKPNVKPSIPAKKKKVPKKPIGKENHLKPQAKTTKSQLYGY